MTVGQLYIINEPTKYQYEKALRDSGYNDFELKFNKTSNSHAKGNRQRKIIWFDPPFSGAVSTNVAKKVSPAITSALPTLQQTS